MKKLVIVALIAIVFVPAFLPGLKAQTAIDTYSLESYELPYEAEMTPFPSEMSDLPFSAEPFENILNSSGNSGGEWGGERPPVVPVGDGVVLVILFTLAYGLFVGVNHYRRKIKRVTL